VTLPALIDQSDLLDQAARQWRTAPWLAVDTEFVRVDTYYAKLCLVQVSDGRDAACVDTLGLDLPPLWKLLHDPGIVKVLHSAAQDLELFVQHTGECPRPLFDTQIAMALLGHGEQIGYAGLVEKRLGIAVDKRLARTDWSRRPLPPAALAYAADDVRHLAELYPALRDELVTRGRLAWLEEECARIADPALYRPDPATAWCGVKGLGRMPAAAQHRAAHLARWREEEAMRRNRPRRWIVDDEILCRLAERMPQTAEDLAKIDGLPPKLRDRAGAALLDVLHQPVAPDAPPLVSDRRPEAEERQRAQKLLAALRQIAEEEQVSATLIATRGDIEALARHGAAADIPLLRSWRREVAGEKLLALLP
jgi:ribonuclease D